MQKALLFMSLTLLLFTFACGGGSSSTSTPHVVGNFSNASLSGQYAYSLSGTAILPATNTFAPYSEAGVFTADGNGHITSGTDDFAQNGAFASNAVTGTYSLHNDGTGNINLVFPSGSGSIQFGVSLLSSSQLYLIETDSFATGGGSAEKQDTTAFAATPSGTFVFRIHVLNATANVGAMTFSGGAISGSEDVLASTGLSSPTLSGTISAPGMDGRGKLALNNGSVTTNFEYYVVSSSALRLLQTDAGVLALGRAEKQASTTFSLASLNGSFAFGSVGDTSASASVGGGGARSVGAFTSGGSGAISAGSYDSVLDGTPTTNVGLTGTYSITSAGRAAVTLNLQNGTTIQDVFWMVSPSRAFFLVNDMSKQEDGTVDLQQSTSFSNASLSGQYAFVMDGFDSTSLVDRVGTFRTDGNGNLSLNEVINRQGTISLSGFLSGTYSVGANGRATGAITNLSNAMVFYIVSSSKAYVLQGDSSTAISGQIGLQQ